jgi:hypothetical protein
LTSLSLTFLPFAYDCRVLTLTLTTSAATASPYTFKSYILISIANVKYKSASKYSPSEAITSSALAPGATLSFFFSGKCLLDSPYEGDITYYTAGLKAYESISNDDTQKVVALFYSLIGPESNNNLYYNKTITVICIMTGKTITTTVVNKCIRYDSFFINLFNITFLDLDDLTVGCTKATWYFNKEH